MNSTGLVSCNDHVEKALLDFRIAFLGEFWKEEAHILRRYVDIPNQSDADVVKETISLVWCQFQLPQDEATGWGLDVACLLNLTGGDAAFDQQYSLEIVVLG